MNHWNFQAIPPNLFIRPAATEEDRQKVFDVRWAGYKKYFRHRDEAIDQYDFASNVTLLLATDDHDNALGTMRILNRTGGDIELDAYLDVESLLSEDEKPCAEATRFSVPWHPNSKTIKWLLWKAAYLYCRVNQIRTMMIWVRPAARRDYCNLLLFQDVEVAGVFHHPVMNQREHHLLKLDVQNAPMMYQSQSPEFYDFLVTQQHPTITVA